MDFAPHAPFTPQRIIFSWSDLFAGDMTFTYRIEARTTDIDGSAYPLANDFIQWRVT